MGGFGMLGGIGMVGGVSRPGGVGNPGGVGGVGGMGMPGGVGNPGGAGGGGNGPMGGIGPLKRWKAAWREVPSRSPISAQVWPSSRACRARVCRMSSTRRLKFRVAVSAASTGTLGRPSSGRSTPTTSSALADNNSPSIARSSCGSMCWCSSGICKAWLDIEGLSRLDLHSHAIRGADPVGSMRRECWGTCVGFQRGAEIDATTSVGSLSILGAARFGKREARVASADRRMWSAHLDRARPSRPGRARIRKGPLFGSSIGGNQRHGRRRQHGSQ